MTVGGLFGTGLLGGAAVSYFTPGGHALYAALVTGLGCGLILALGGWTEIHKDAAALKRPLRRLTSFSVLTAGSGIALLVWGVGSGDASLALSGLPLTAVGVGLMAARHLLER